jgi:hypothetical protein
VCKYREVGAHASPQQACEQRFIAGGGERRYAVPIEVAHHCDPLPSAVPVPTVCLCMEVIYEDAVKEEVRDE